MTFIKFQETVSHFKPSLMVYNYGTNKVGVCFNGENSKVYEYRGSYCQILNKLGITAISKYDYEQMQTMLQKYERQNGQLNDFWNDGSVYDWTVEIKDLKEEMSKIQAVVS